MRPKHVLLIPDGNRRFARANGISFEDGYKMAAWRVGDVAEWVLKDGGAERFTVYGLSYENVTRRTKKEVAPIEEAWAKEMERWLTLPWISDEGVRVVVRGHTELLSKWFRETIDKVEAATRANSKKELCLLLGYSGQKDIIAAARRLRKPTHKKFVQNLHAGEPIDLVIRTGGTLRLSNCPLYAVAYAELFFMKKMFPEITKGDVMGAITEFERRKRNFGK